MSQCKFDDGCESQGCEHTRRTCPRARRDFWDALPVGSIGLWREPDGGFIEVSKGLDGLPVRGVVVDSKQGTPT